MLITNQEEEGLRVLGQQRAVGHLDCSLQRAAVDRPAVDEEHGDRLLAAVVRARHETLHRHLLGFDPVLKEFYITQLLQPSAAAASQAGNLQKSIRWPCCHQCSMCISDPGWLMTFDCNSPVYTACISNCQAVIFVCEISHLDFADQAALSFGIRLCLPLHVQCQAVLCHLCSEQVPAGQGLGSASP